MKAASEPTRLMGQLTPHIPKDIAVCMVYHIADMAMTLCLALYI